MRSGFALELQAEFNQEFLDTLHQIELDDWGRYGEIRQKRDLRDPDDVFLQAEERKKSLPNSAREQPGKILKNRKALSISLFGASPRCPFFFVAEGQHGANLVEIMGQHLSTSSCS